MPHNNCTWPGRIFYDKLVPCGPVNDTNPYVPCCGIGDSCLSGSICQYTHSLTGGSGYYTAGCSNGANDYGFLRPAEQPVCPNRCAGTGHPDIVWDSSTQIWKCCGATANGTISCQSPTSENFVAPAPSDLISYWSAGAPVAPSVSATAVAESTAPPSATTTAPTSDTGQTTPSSNPFSAPPITPGVSASSHSSGLSTGAIAGIGVGGGLGVLLLAAGAFFLLRRRKKGQHPTQTQRESLTYLGAPKQSALKQPALAELTAEMEPAELSAESSVELSAEKEVDV